MKKIESSKLFPIIAWLLILSFATFIYLLAKDIEATNNRLGKKTIYTENAIKDPQFIRDRENNTPSI